MNGLNNEQVLKSRKENGTNSITQAKKNSFLKLLYVRLYFFNFSDISLLFFRIDRTKCSVPIYGCFKSSISIFALFSISCASSLKLLIIFITFLRLFYEYNVIIMKILNN